MDFHHIMMLIHHKLYDSYKLYYCLFSGFCPRPPPAGQYVIKVCDRLSDSRGRMRWKGGLYWISAIRTGPATFIEVCCLTLVEVVAAVGVEGAGVLEQQGWHCHHLPHHDPHHQHWYNGSPCLWGHSWAPLRLTEVDDRQTQGSQSWNVSMGHTAEGTEDEAKRPERLKVNVNKSWKCFTFVNVKMLDW